MDTNDSKPTRNPLRWIVGLAFTGLCAVSATVALGVDYPRDPQTVVASYTLEIGELRDADPGPSVRVYGDGRAVVHIPVYMKRAGDYRVQLSAAEMDTLMNTLAADELLNFDARTVSEAKAASRLNRGGGAAGEVVLYEETDPSITHIEMQVTPAGQGGGAGQGTPVTKKISWAGLESDSRQFPDVGAIQKLNAAKQRLSALMERGDLQSIE